MYTLFYIFISGYRNAKIIEISQNMTELQSSIHCHVLWTAVKV